MSAMTSVPEHDLLDAIVAISSNLDTHSVLQRIVESACRLTQSSYGALGVLGAGGDREHLVDFITHGIDPAGHEAIGALPTGLGVLGHTLNEPLVLDNISAHPDSLGFPANHPAMRTLLGVPIKVRGATFGNLYVTEKRDGRRFTGQDVLQLTSLATVAGIVIENARAFSLGERRRRWLEVYSRLNELLLPPITLSEAFQRISDAMFEVSAARFVGVVQVPEDGSPVVAAWSGTGVAVTDRENAAFEAICRQVATSGEPSTVAIQDLVGVYAPLRAHLATPGVVLGLFPRNQHPEDAIEEQELLTSYAEQAGLAIDRTQALQDRAEMAVVSDRDRIARELHDVVIQRLFAAGLYMQSTRSMTEDPALGERLDTSMRDLDQTIRDIRSTIFALQSRPQISLRTAIGDLVKEFVPRLGFTPSVELMGPVDNPLAAKTQQQLLDAVREALSNVARHSGATESSVDVQVTESHLRVRVTDNGSGIAADSEERGLGAVRRRAALAGGRVDLWANDPTGTVYVWQIPLA